MAHHPMSFSQNSLYLHSSGSEGIDCAEGARLFFYCGSRRVLLNHRRPVANDSPSPCRPKWHAPFIVIRRATISPRSTLSRGNYCTWNTIWQRVTLLPARHSETAGLMRLCPLALMGINLYPARSALPLRAGTVCTTKAVTISVDQRRWTTNFVPYHFP